MKRYVKSASGFSMIELLFAAAIFTIVAGGVFSVLLNSQMRYRSESGLTNAFQEANIVMDQLTRDIHSAGFPPPSMFNATVSSQKFAIAFPWSPGYPNPSATCIIGATCTAPGDTELILEADLGNGVQWIRYTLVGTTLMRGMMPKPSGTDPLSLDWSSYLTPYLENVINQNLSPPAAIFVYSDATGAGTTDPTAIHEVNVYLRVQSSVRDPQTGQFRTIALTGQAVRFNGN